MCDRYSAFLVLARAQGYVGGFHEASSHCFLQELLFRRVVYLFPMDTGAVAPAHPSSVIRFVPQGGARRSSVDERRQHGRVEYSTVRVSIMRRCWFGARADARRGRRAEQVASAPPLLLQGSGWAWTRERLLQGFIFPRIYHLALTSYTSAKPLSLGALIMNHRCCPVPNLIFLSSDFSHSTISEPHLYLTSISLIHISHPYPGVIGSSYRTPDQTSYVVAWYEL